MAPLTRTLERLGRALQRFGLNLICDWYEGTRFTPASSQLPL